MNESIKRLAHQQDRRRLAFIIIIIVFVYAQSYQGRVFLRDQLLDVCHTNNVQLRDRVGAPRLDCEKAYRAPTPWPW